MTPAVGEREGGSGGQNYPRLRIHPANYLNARLLVRLGASQADAQRFAGPIADTLRAYDIDSKLRAAHWLAQILHESARLRYVEELASGAAYEGRRDLGNVKPGDGRRYKGRGLIQLTGRSNYEQFGLESGRGAAYYTAQPARVAELPHAAEVAGWYWQSRGLNRLADRGRGEEDVRAVTRIINGGYNGLADRLRLFAIASRVLSEAERAYVADLLAATGTTRIEPLPPEPLPALPEVPTPEALR